MKGKIWRAEESKEPEREGLMLRAPPADFALGAAVGGAGGGAHSFTDLWPVEGETHRTSLLPYAPRATPFLPAHHPSSP